MCDLKKETDIVRARRTVVPEVSQTKEGKFGSGTKEESLNREPKLSLSKFEIPRMVGDEARQSATSKRYPGK